MSETVLRRGAADELGVLPSFQQALMGGCGATLDTGRYTVPRSREGNSLCTPGVFRLYEFPQLTDNRIWGKLFYFSGQFVT